MMPQFAHNTGPGIRLHQNDPLPTIFAYLNQHPRIITNFPVGAVGGINEPPYPHLVVTHAGSTDYAGMWRTETEVQLEVYASAIDNAPGNAELRRLLYLTIGVLVELPYIATFSAGEVVITDVLPSTGGNFVPDITGQGRYMSRVAVSSHPPLVG
jgi:hypothetical protein